MGNQLIINGNAVYEVDEKCKKKQLEEKKDNVKYQREERQSQKKS